jgi:hypothetical protein
MKDCCCSNARDRVYANLSLIKQDCRFSVQPNYTTPTNEVYRIVFTQYFKLHNILNIMTCQMRQLPFNFVLQIWVPNWSIPVSQRAWHAMVSDCSGPEYQISEDTLTTTAVFIDSVVDALRYLERIQSAHLMSNPLLSILVMRIPTYINSRIPWAVLFLAPTRQP